MLSALLLNLYIGGSLVEQDLSITDSSVLIQDHDLDAGIRRRAYTHSPGVGWSSLHVSEDTL